jgi:hypothetical protein
MASISRLGLHSLLIVVLLACGGCAVGQRKLDLQIPAGAKVVDGSKGAVQIVSVIDKRTFENKPSDPSTPSIDGDVKTLSASQKNKMIGRQRNSWGKAMGDIALIDGQTVESRTRALVTEALKRRGYAVTDSQSKNRAEIAVDKFWAWFTPGMFAVDFEAHIQANLQLSLNGRSGKFTVLGHGRNLGAVGSNSNWQEAYARAFEDFLANFETALRTIEDDVGLNES